MNKFLVFLISSVMFLNASPLEVGSSLSVLDNYKYETPHGRVMKVPSSSSLVIVAFDKDTGTMINDYLKTQGKYYLQKNHAIFISDIHTMPRFITNMFVLPKMKKYKHLLYLHYEKEFHKIVPRQNDKATLLRFVDGKITRIYYATSKEDIKIAIEQ